MKKAEDTRERRTWKNMVISPICQVIALLCGIVIPRLMIGSFGSEAYGATTSIANFLSYITLLEGGIGGVARAALYKPLANHDIATISRIIGEVKRFFRVIAFIFAAYVIALACTFRSISNVESLDWVHSFVLVVIISISTFVQYFIGISYSILIQAAQRKYVVSMVDTLTIVLNVIMVLVLVNLNCSLIVVKLASSIVFVIRPFFSWMYVRKKFALISFPKEKSNYLKDKWVGLGQHIAFFLHSNTDVVLLTCLSNLKSVAVYSVYHMVISSVQNLVVSFSMGMESLFGELLSKQEQEELHRVFGNFETLTSVITTLVFSATGALLVPFVQIYTHGINDVNYAEPIFGITLVFAAIVSCLRTPYHNIVIAAGHFRQTQVAAYGEAIINVFLSAILVVNYGLIGVAIGTLVATSYRYVYYVYYISRNILKRKIRVFVRRISVNLFLVFVALCVGLIIMSAIKPSTYLQWIVSAVIVTSISAFIVFGGNFAFYSNELKCVAKMLFRFGYGKN